jgi:prepilin-type processing-associated H-X9-DG protein
LVDQTKHWRDIENRAALQRPLLFMRCPSAGNTQLTDVGSHVTGLTTENNLRCHYVGILGARPGPNKDAGQLTDGCATGRGSTFTPPESTYLQRFCSRASSSSGSGGPAINGAIIPLSNVRFGSITDGSSKTMMFGEMSWDCGIQEMWMIGSTSLGSDPVENSYGVLHNVKNIRYGIHAKKYSEPETLPLTPAYNSALRDDPKSEYAPLTETRLGSHHPGGTHVSMCDGSATFLRDDVDVTGVLRRMASRASEDVYDSGL